MISRSAPAATITVGPGENIQAAIDKASPGDIIEVKSGNYKECIEITKSLTLIGIDSGEGIPVIDGRFVDSTVHLAADRCQLMGFKLLNSQGHGVSVNSNFCSITNNTIEACSAGIFLREANSNVISHNDARISCQGLISLLRGDAVQLMDSNNNIIKGNNATGAFIGIYLFHSHNNTVVENHAQGNDHGISLLGSGGNTVRGNNPINNAQDGIGFLDDCVNNIISENTATGNAIGILLQDSSNNIVYLNDFINNEQNAKSTRSQNRWHSPEPMNYSSRDKSITSYLGNYWSDYNGSDSDGNGIGDDPYKFNGDQDDHPLMKRGIDFLKA
ncbi:MAG: nitrous oxide reductase family maturation protein NosD [Methanotrichaceae archaeon]